MHKNNHLLAAAAIAVASFGVLAPRADAHNQSADVIIEWNQLLQQNIGGPPFAQTRTYAMVHIAMADAVVAIEGGYEPYRVRAWAPRGASAEAAAAQAAHDVLVVLIPTGQTAFAMALEKRLATIPPGPALKWSLGRQESRGSDSGMARDRRFRGGEPAASGLPGIHAAWDLETNGVRTGAVLETRRRGTVRLAHALRSSCRAFSRSWKVPNTLRASTRSRTRGARRDRRGRPRRLASRSCSPRRARTSTRRIPFRLWSNVARDVSQERRLLADEDGTGVRVDDCIDPRQPADFANQQVRLSSLAAGDCGRAGRC